MLNIFLSNLLLLYQMLLRLVFVLLRNKFISFSLFCCCLRFKNDFTKDLSTFKTKRKLETQTCVSLFWVSSCKAW